MVLTFHIFHIEVMTLNRLGTVFLFITLLILLLSSSTRADNDYKVAVVTTIPPLAAIAREVGGDRVNVYYLVPPGSDPHQYALKPDDVERVRSCDLFISVGKEAFLGSLPEDIEGIKLSWDDWISAGIYVKDDNPHYLWLYPENAVKIAAKICEVLTIIDPGGREYYERNFEAFKNKIDELVEWIDDYTRVSGVKGEKVVLAGAHFEPLATVMGLKVVGVLIKGEGKIPSPQEVAQIENIIRNEDVSAIVVLATQKIGDEGRIAASISKETGVPIVYVYGVMFSGDDTYTEHIKYTVTAIAAAIEAGRTRGITKSSTFSFSYTTLVTSIIVLTVLVIIETFVLVRGK